MVTQMDPMDSPVLSWKYDHGKVRFGGWQQMHITGLNGMPARNRQSSRRSSFAAQEDQQRLARTHGVDATAGSAGKVDRFQQLRGVLPLARQMREEHVTP